MRNPSQVRINVSSSSPVYRQIVEQLRTLAVDGILTPGSSLPSVRRLALDLGIHFNTVAEAHRTMAEEGWIEILHGRGVRVRNRTMPGPPESSKIDDFRQRLRHLVSEMRAQGVTPARISRELSILAQGLKQ
jgi:GntR family transcriptional regulator